jgi:HSP20 family protein
MAVGNLIPWRNRNSVSVNTRRDPFLALHEEMNRWFDDFARGFDLPTLRSDRGLGWPSIEVREDDKRYCVEAELPGMEEKDIEVTLLDNVLRIRGEKRHEEEDAKRQYSERYFGQFERRIVLDGEVDSDKVKAKFKNGVLKIEIPKAPEAQSRVKRIAVSS